MANQVSPDASVADIIRSLESKTAVNTERCETYAKFTRHFRENDVTLFGLDVAKDIGRILAVIKTDASSTCMDVANGALQVLGACLYDTDIVNATSVEDGKDIISMLCSIISKTEDKSVCSCALWCLKSQNLNDGIIREQVEDVFSSVELALEKWLGTSVSVVHECINALDRLNTQARKEMNTMGSRWGKLLIPLVVHDAVRVRERALVVIESSLSSLKEANKILASVLKSQIKQKVMPRLKTLFKENQECYVLKCWGVLVSLYGEELHHTSYINEFLPIVELGFKSTEPQVKIAAFQAWQQLINNFALNQAILQDPKRIKLIMQVFKHNNARNESVAMEKLSCWWHFIWLLGSKVSPNFDMVAAPLLQFCIGGKATEHGGASTPKMIKPGASPVTPHLKLTSTGTQQYPVFKSLQLRGCEVLAHFLGNVEDETVDYCFKMDALRHDVVTGPSFYVKQSSLLVTSATELFCTLGKDIPENLIIHIWQWLISHMKNAIESPAKLDIRDPLNTLLQQFQVLVLSRSISDHIVLKILMRLSSLPKKVLCSSAYGMGGTERVNGTPALYLTGLLLTPNLLQSCGDMETYHVIFQSLLNNSVGYSTCTLEFLQSVMDILNDNAQFVENSEILGRLWSAVATPFLEYVNKSNEVNQGDSLELNFQCSVQILTFPVIHKLHRIQQQSEKTMVKTWTELYRTVNRLAAMVTNADANVICEEVCSKILADVKDDNLKEPEMVSLLSQMSHVITSCLDFSSTGNQSTFNLGVSPKKLSKKKHRPLENIHSLVHLLALLLQRIVKLVDESEAKKKSNTISLQAVLNSLTDTLCIFFTHVTSAGVISNLIGQLASPIGNLFAEASKKSTVKVYSNAFLQKLEKLWSDICTCLQSRYTSMFDSELLHKLSPLLESTFLHSRRQIKNQTLSLWTSTFSKAASLDYPESFKPVLERVKAKSVIHLPGWVAVDTLVIEDTPISQMTQTQAPEPVIPGMPSPHKIHGSFLHKPVSPHMNRSPMKSPLSPRPVGSAKKKVFKLDNFDDGDFVVIKHSPKKKMLLTDHQKEMMKEKREIGWVNSPYITENTCSLTHVEKFHLLPNKNKALPAMYNSLEQSMDASLMAAHFTTDTQMDGSQSGTPTPTSQPFSLFGSIIPPTGQDKVPTDIKKKEVTQKSPKSSDVNSVTVDNEDSSGPRRSTRGKQKKVMNVGKNKKEDKKVVSSSTSSPSNSSETEDDKHISDKTDSFVNTIPESEPMDVESEGGDNETQNKKSNKLAEENSTNVKSNTVVDLTNSQSDSTTSTKSDSGVDKSSSSEFVASSVPQNILGAIGYTPSSSKSSAEEDKEVIVAVTSQTTKDTDVASKDLEDANKASSEPLLSWTQKLNELSQSPRPASPSKKWSSQDSAISPQRRMRSPFKSPKRGRKKLTDENDGKGLLDKWIIRSPAKTSLMDNMNTDVIVANVSQTLVEETQSPTKFNKKGKQEDANSPSIMETPPKNVLETINVNHSNSSRKLFGSQEVDAFTNMIEDSNMVPASPNSKSFTVKTGTPVIKLKKLTQDEICKHSPSRRQRSDNNDNVAEYFNEEKTNGSAKKVIICSVDALDNHDSESSHAHDDFSVFTPLDCELNVEEADGVKNAEQACLDGAKNVENNELSGSENLFSQDEAAQKSRSNISISKKKNLEADNSEISVKAIDDSQTEASSQDDTDISQVSQVSTPRRGRKRKQITPKKMTPEDMKRKKKDVEKGSVKQHATRSKKRPKKLSDVEKNVCDDSEQKSDENEQSQNNELINTAESDTSSSLSNSTKKRGRRKIAKKGDNDISVSHSEEKEKEPDANVSDSNRVTESTNDSINGATNKDQTKIKEKGRAKIISSEKAKENDLEVDVESKPDNLDENDGNVCSGSKDGKESGENEHISMDVDDKSGILTDELPGEVEIVGQKTPEGHKSSVKEPERRSTTKHKKAVVQKMNLRRSKDIMINDSDSNLDAEDDVLMLDHKLVKMDGTANNEMHAVSEKSNDPTPSKTDTSDSDDNIPLSQMHETLKGKVKDLEEHSDNSKKTDRGKTSPMSKKMKQNTSKTNTRLRSGKNAKRSPQAKKSINLAIKRSKKKSSDNVQTDELEVPVAKANITADVFKDENSNSKDICDIKETETVVENAGKMDANKRDMKITEDKLNVTETTTPEELEETPRKGTAKSIFASMLMMRNSDSKLVIGSRKFEKRKGIARRSILKPSASESTDVTISPQRMFHPIQVARIYSPTASPSASILKRRRLSEDPCSDTNSPPAKQRRVSFASPLDDSNCEILPVNSERPCSPLTVQDKQAPELAIEKTGATIGNETSDLTLSDKPAETQSTQGSPSQKNYESSQGTQISSSEPVCPELIGCSQGVEKVLPQLTSSMWCRGLGQLVRARNIHTIGDLSALSESDVDSLPIRSPKVVNVRKVLKEYGKSLQSSRNKMLNAPKLRLESQLKSDEEKPKEEASSKKNQDQTDAGDKLNKNDVESMLASSGDLLDEVKRLSQCVDQSGDNLSCDQENSQSGPTYGIQNLNLVETLTRLSDTCAEDIKGLSANELVKVSKQLTQMLTDVNKAIANIVSTRCSSPNR